MVLFYPIVKVFDGFHLTIFFSIAGEFLKNLIAKLLELRYKYIGDALEILDGVNSIRKTFIELQKHLYEYDSA
jgi:hypothetical protein